MIMMVRMVEMVTKVLTKMMELAVTGITVAVWWRCLLLQYGGGVNCCDKNDNDDNKVDVYRVVTKQQK